MKHLKQRIFLLDKYRKYVRNIKSISFYQKKIFLICNLVFFGGFSLKLLREYFCSKVFETYNYKHNFDFLMLTSKSQNYVYNYKFQKLSNKNIVFFFDNFNDIYLFLYKIKTLTLSPYFFFPLYFFSTKFKTVLPFNYLSAYFRNYEYEYGKNDFFYYIYINIIKKIIFTIFVFIVSKIAL